MDIRFYHLTRDPIETALPLLLEKVVGAGHRVLICVGDMTDDDIVQIDKALWSYRADSFLAHDRDGCKHPEAQPIFITRAHENANNADVLMLLNGTDSALRPQMAMTLQMFDGTNPDIVSSCRAHWAKWKADGAALTYWQQTESGGWAQKA